VLRRRLPRGIHSKVAPDRVAWLVNAARFSQDGNFAARFDVRPAPTRRLRQAALLMGATYDPVVLAELGRRLRRIRPLRAPGISAQDFGRPSAGKTQTAGTSQMRAEEDSKCQASHRTRNIFRPCDCAHALLALASACSSRRPDAARSRSFTWATCTGTSCRARVAERPSKNEGASPHDTKIEEIRAAARRPSVLFNTGDTIQGSAEALFTRGQALVDVLNHFRIDAYAPGNWDWVYGTDRALELLRARRESTLACARGQRYYEGEPYADRKGDRLLPPYLVREIDGVKVGILGFTTDRGPQVVGAA